MVPQHLLLDKGMKAFEFLGAAPDKTTVSLVSEARLALEVLLLHRGEGMGVLVRRDCKVFPSLKSRVGGRAKTWTQNISYSISPLFIL